VKRKKYGFTILEILTVMVVIAILVGVLIPALTMVHTIAKETQQRAQFMEINLALEAFKGDYGDYPPSEWNDEDEIAPPEDDYCGGQKLTEALVGWDLVGFDPNSDWRADGRDADDSDPPVYDLTGTDEERDEELQARLEPYLGSLERVFQLGCTDGKLNGRYRIDTAPLEPATYVICDVYAVQKVMFDNGGSTKAGTPILYYRANTSSKTIESPTAFEDRIYNVRDNLPLINLKWQEDRQDNPGKDMPPLMNPSGSYDFFYSKYIRDPKVTTPTMIWPYRPDSYILVSAGKDGEYGTDDDIRNFGY
jgi:prepilin-type N-terminal cleavage/methylation domain-containing protein